LFLNNALRSVINLVLNNGVAYEWFDAVFESEWIELLNRINILTVE